MARNKRIEKLCTFLHGYDRVLDIGSDHGLLLKYALDDLIIKSGIASEINESPLMNAKNNLLNYQVDFYLSDGFLQINDSFDVAVIAGMGVHTIIDIIKHAPEVDLILQPNSKIDVLRRYLSDNGYVIIDEDIIFDDFYYVILKAKKGNQPLDEKDIFLGPILKHRKSSIDYYKNKINVIKSYIADVDGIKKEELLKLIEIYQSAVRNLEG